jgi:O-glycosyl hydrolase
MGSSSRVLGDVRFGESKLQWLATCSKRRQGSAVAVTAYEGGDPLVVVAVNRNTTQQVIGLDVFDGCATELNRVTTCVDQNLADDGGVTLVNGRAQVILEAERATTFLSR